MARTKRPRQRIRPHKRHLGKLAARKLRPVRVPVRNPLDYKIVLTVPDFQLVKPCVKQAN